MATRDPIQQFGPNDSPPRCTARLAQLHDEAVARFGARCLWNAAPSKSIDGMGVIADRLRRHGGMDAWRLATEIRKALHDATERF